MAYRDWTYHGRPVPSFLPTCGPAGAYRDGAAMTPEAARLLIVGLAPAAHGANRTGRMFTGDRSGDFLYAALYETGFATQPQSTAADDGLELVDCIITAAVHCAPPANKPTREELAACAGWLSLTLDGITRLKAVVCLGRIAFDAMVAEYRQRGWIGTGRGTTPWFAHGAVHFDPAAGPAGGGGVPALIGCYHPSQQNTFTGRLTMPMLVEVFASARRIIEGA